VTGKLAIDGGDPAVVDPLPPMFPGGLRIGAAEERAVVEVIRSKRLFRYYGPTPGESKAAQLEKAFAEQLGARHCLAVNSGTSALVAALAAIGVGPGDEVIIPAYSFVAILAAVLATGAVPILAEVDQTLTISAADVADKMTDRTRAVIPVHMRGAPSDLDTLTGLAETRGVALVEDVAQAAGASYRGRRLGTFGAAGAFSLQYNKIITAGEGGLVITSDDTLYARARMYHDTNSGLRHNIPPEEIALGGNLRISELQAAVALVQLDKMDRIVADARRHFKHLDSVITDVLAATGVSARTSHDAAGDANICYILMLPNAEQAGRVAPALAAEGVRGAHTLFDPNRSDPHVYYFWDSLLARRSWTSPGPWDWHPSPVSYHPGMCTRTLQLLSRAVAIDVSPDLSSSQVEQVGDAVTKVLSALV
jgi:8-amino-3,8-dideoxy-alpha-D-manno-octulosonate transaminase